MTLADEVSIARKRIFRDGYDISFGELVSLYEKGELIIQPEYQRLFRWDQTQKTRFIESLLLNIPIPPIFVFSDEFGRWELVDGLQRVSTVLEFMGLLRGESKELLPSFTCDGTALVPSLRGVRWPSPDEANQPDGGASHEVLPEVLPVSLQLGVRRARIRVEILGQETDAHAKYELFQRLNSGGANLSEQELRNCIVVAINKAAFDDLRKMSEEPLFRKLVRVSEEGIKRQYLLELVVRFVVLRHYVYQKGMDVHEYLDKGIISVAENKEFDWESEKMSFRNMLQLLDEAVGDQAFLKNKRFSLGMYEFVTLGLSKAADAANRPLVIEHVADLINGASKLDEAEKYTGIGVRGTQRLEKFVVPMAETYFGS